MIDGVNPNVQRHNAFCGQSALYLPNSVGLLDDSSRWGRIDMHRLVHVDESGNSHKRFGWKTDEFPYMYMAYRCDVFIFCFLSLI